MLTDKQRLFCREYLTDLNATQAAIRAGYSEKTARSIGQENLTKPDIQAEVQRMMRKRVEMVDRSAADVVKALEKIAFFDIKELYNEDGSLKPINELPDHIAVAICGVEFETSVNEDGEVVTEPKRYKLADKKGALELLGRHLGLFQGRKEQSPDTTRLPVSDKVMAMIEKTKKRLALIEGVPESELRKLKDRQVTPPEDPTVE